MSERDALDVLYAGWAGYQQKLHDALEPLEDAQLGLRAAPHLRTVGELLQHLIAVRAGWFHGDLGMGGEEWTEIARWDEPGAAQRSAGELRSGLDATWRLVSDSIAGWSGEDLVATVHSAWPGQEHEEYIRGWVVWHVMEHDVHHGGELGFLLGMHGLPAPDI